jgi:hypothetical protein
LWSNYDRVAATRARRVIARADFDFRCRFSSAVIAVTDADPADD